MKVNFGKKTILGAFTLAGTMIGAGMLGLPFVFSRSGFLIGIFWLVLLGLIMTLVHLYMGEIILRTRGEHQLPGYAEKYLGVAGKKVMFFAMFFGIYSALVAYLIGEGQSLSYFFMGNLGYAIVFGCLFWFIMTLLLRNGLKGLKKLESWSIPAVIIIVFILLFYLLPQIKFENLAPMNYDFFFVPLGVTLFALLGFSSIPEVGRVMKGQEKNMKFALLIGSLIPIVLYAIFGFAFVGVFGNAVKEVATISVGRYASLLGVLTMVTSYFVLSFALKDMFEVDLKMKKQTIFFLVYILPIILYLVISLFDLVDFVRVLGIGGVISGGITGMLILLMNYKSKKYAERTPEYWIPINWFIIAFISLLFIIAVIIQLGILDVI
ncbi:MAG: aromatic amino acid transport family protein [Candidatus Pacearchaeota archaeon]|jgi:tyrosine-specific transport protein